MSTGKVVPVCTMNAYRETGGSCTHSSPMYQTKARGHVYTLGVSPRQKYHSCLPPWMLGWHQRQFSYYGAGKILWPCSESNLDSLVALSQYWLSHPGSFFTDSFGTAIPWKWYPTETKMATLNKASSRASLLRCYATRVGSYLHISWTATPLKMVLPGWHTTLANNYKCVTSLKNKDLEYITAGAWNLPRLPVV